MSSSLLPVFCALLVIGVPSRGYPITSCDQTPYPEVCRRYIDTQDFDSKTVDVTVPHRFYSIALQRTMDHAMLNHRTASNVDTRSFHDPRAKLAWSDCLQLYRETIRHINRSIDTKHSLSDAQTWLSAAMANQQTCRDGFVDFKLTSHLETLPLDHLSQLISNSLAINKAMAKAEKSSAMVSNNNKTRFRKLLFSEDFPTWIPISDRKHLVRSVGAPNPDLVVARDGSGDHRTLSDAVAAAAKMRKDNRRFVIYVKAGVYRENVEIKKSMKRMMFIGDGMDATIITGSRNVQDGSTTFRSATFAVSGKGFIARDMTFENTAGPAKHQAVALRSGSDFSVFYRCSFKGHQDTLYVHSQRQFYRNCRIYGTVDFIFGDAAAVFQNCEILVRKPMSNQRNTITAQGRKDPGENTGIVIQNSLVTAAEALGSAETYLGRPWHEYSRTVIMKTVLGGLVNPAGWFPWSGDFAISTLYYAEYMNTGKGASTWGRVKWPGFHHVRAPDEAAEFSVRNFLAGDSWIPISGVPFDSEI